MQIRWWNGCLARVKSKVIPSTVYNWVWWWVHGYACLLAVEAKASRSEIQGYP